MESRTSSSSKPLNQNATQPTRVLVVEDHDDTREMMARLLRRAGFAVESAADAAGARQVAQAQKFDIVVSDLGLPDASGVDLMRYLSQSHGLRGIALSGYEEEGPELSGEAGFVAHLTKPVNIEKLASAIRAAIA